MRKVLWCILIITLTFALIGCAPKKVEEVEEAPVPTGPQDPYAGFEVFPDFKVQDIHGQEVTHEIFAKRKLTLVNLWATNCGPCIAELPDLQELHEEMEELGVAVLGVIADGGVNDGVARDYLDQLSVTYTNIIPDDQLMEDFVSHTMWVPVSLMVDQEGNIVGETISGARDKAGYRSIIEEGLKMVK